MIDIGIGTKGPLIWMVAKSYTMPEDCMSIQEIRFVLDRYWSVPFDAPNAKIYNGSHILHKDIAWLAKINKFDLFHLIDGRVMFGQMKMVRLARQLEKIEHGLIVKKYGRIVREKKPTLTPARFYRGNVQFLTTGRPVVNVGRLRGPSPGLMGLPNVFKIGKGLK